MPRFPTSHDEFMPLSRGVGIQTKYPRPVSPLQIPIRSGLLPDPDAPVPLLPRGAFEAIPQKAPKIGDPPLPPRCTPKTSAACGGCPPDTCCYDCYKTN